MCTQRGAKFLVYSHCTVPLRGYILQQHQYILLVTRSRDRSLIAMYTRTRLDEFTAKRNRQLLIEAITPEQLQSYVGWFSQIRKFMGQHNVPTLRIATDKAYDDITLLFGGDKDSLKNKLGKIIKAGDAEQKRLDAVNRFLWGVTTVIGMLPVIIATVDQQLGEKFSAVDDKDAKFKEVIVLAARDIKKAAAATAKFEQLIVGAFKSSVAQFGPGGVPYITDPKKVSNDLLDLSLNDILNIGKAALALKKRWSTGEKSMQAAAKSLDAVADGKQATEAKPTSQDPATGGDSKTSSQVVDLGEDGTFDLSPQSLKNVGAAVTKKLAALGKMTASGKQPDANTIAALRDYTRAVKRLAA
jgi:hypothetical protein